ncbi:MAG: 4Fe-4S dicluster domain-containing protein [Desulfonatronovibrio sp.]
MAAENQNKRQWAKVVDLNKCLGCQECTSACKMWWTNRQGADRMWWAVVETRPGPGFPRDWEQVTAKGRMPSDADYGDVINLEYDKLQTGDGSDEIRLLPEGNPVFGPNWYADVGEGTEPGDTWFFHMHLSCMHCSDPACVEACPNKAIYKRDDGIVLINQDLCKGHKGCVLACPYKRIFWNKALNSAEKCHFCFSRVEEDKPPMCVISCTAKAIFSGDVNDENSRVYKLVRDYKVALPLHPEYGTSPNIYFIPPVLSAAEKGAAGPAGKVSRIPEGYLLELFGPDVRQAMAVIINEREKTRQGRTSQLMDILTGYPTWDV